MATRAIDSVRMDAFLRDRADEASISTAMPEEVGGGVDLIVEVEDSEVLLVRNVAFEVKSDAAEIPQLVDDRGMGGGGGRGGDRIVETDVVVLKFWIDLTENLELTDAARCGGSGGGRGGGTLPTAPKDVE